MAKKKPTPEQEKEQRIDNLVRAHLRVVEQALVDNVGNRLTSEVGSGIYASISKSLLQTVAELNNVHSK